MGNNIDKLFKSKLEGHEPDFHPAAWDRMEGLLDDAGMVPDAKKGKKSRLMPFKFRLEKFINIILHNG